MTLSIRPSPRASVDPTVTNNLIQGSRLEDLCPELLEIVCRYLCPVDVRHLSLVSKGLKERCLPLLDKVRICLESSLPPSVLQFFSPNPVIPRALPINWTRDWNIHTPQLPPLKIGEIVDVTSIIEAIFTHRFEEISNAQCPDIHTLMSIEREAFTAEQLGQLLVAISQERLSHQLVNKCISAIMSSSRFGQISLENIQTAFINAARNGQIKTIKALMSSAYFAQIDAQALREAFEKAASNGRRKVVRAIMGDDCFADIDHDSLGWGFQFAATNDHLKIVRAIMNHLRFVEIHQDALRRAFKLAALNGCRRVLRAIMSDARFADIDQEALRRGFEFSALNGLEEIVKAIMADDRFVDIDQEAFGTAFEFAAGNGHEKIVRVIIDNPRFSEINQGSLGRGFVSAAGNGHEKIVRVIIDNPHFLEISHIKIVRGVVRALFKGYLGVIKSMVGSIPCVKKLTISIIEISALASIGAIAFQAMMSSYVE